MISSRNQERRQTKMGGRQALRQRSPEARKRKANAGVNSPDGRVPPQVRQIELQMKLAQAMTRLDKNHAAAIARLEKDYRDDLAGLAGPPVGVALMLAAYFLVQAGLSEPLSTEAGLVYFVGIFGGVIGLSAFLAGLEAASCAPGRKAQLNERRNHPPTLQDAQEAVRKARLRELRKDSSFADGTASRRTHRRASSPSASNMVSRSVPLLAPTVLNPASPSSFMASSSVSTSPRTGFTH